MKKNDKLSGYTPVFIGNLPENIKKRPLITYFSQFQVDNKVFSNRLIHLFRKKCCAIIRVQDPVVVKKLLETQHTFMGKSLDLKIHYSALEDKKKGGKDPFPFASDKRLKKVTKQPKKQDLCYSNNVTLFQAQCSEKQPKTCNRKEKKVRKKCEPKMFQNSFFPQGIRISKLDYVRKSEGQKCEMKYSFRNTNRAVVSNNCMGSLEPLKAGILSKIFASKLGCQTHSKLELVKAQHIKDQGRQVERFYRLNPIDFGYRVVDCDPAL